MATLTAAPIAITNTASKEISLLLAHRNKERKEYLRVGVKGGGCSGLSYVLGFDFENENDEIFETNGIPCIINKNHLLYLQGLEIDWHNGLDARGFVFNNPNASSGCGCGSSFSV